MLGVMWASKWNNIHCSLLVVAVSTMWAVCGSLSWLVCSL